MTLRANQDRGKLCLGKNADLGIIERLPIHYLHVYAYLGMYCVSGRQHRIGFVSALGFLNGYYLGI
jgi:hypothetical protein